MKNVRFFQWQLVHCWTDQKLRVHAFYSVLALLVSSLDHKEVRHTDVEISLLSLINGRSVNRQIALLYPQGSGGKSHITLSCMSSQQKKLIEIRQIQALIAEGQYTLYRNCIIISKR